MNVNNNASHLSSSSLPDAHESGLPPQNNHNHLLNIVGTEARRPIDFIAGLIGDFLNSNRGTAVNLNNAEPLDIARSLSSNVSEAGSDTSSDYPQTPAPQYYASSRQTAVSVPQTPNPEMFASRSRRDHS